MTDTATMDRTAFLTALDELERRFDALEPEFELIVRDPEYGVEGFVVVWNTSAAIGGPLGRIGKGGTRITPTVSRDEIAMLARIMTLKNAAAGLPLGGAKSGLVGDPDAPGFERTYRRFVELVEPVLAEHGGPFGGFGFDIGARPEHVSWACDQLQSLRSFTGKPVEMGGTDYDNEGIAGLGVVAAAAALLESDGKKLAGSTVAVQGLGAMGAAVVKYAAERGAKIVAVSDPRIGGTVRFSDGLPTSMVERLAARDLDAVVRELAELKVACSPSDEVLFDKATVLFPAATQDVIDRKNEKRIRAAYLVEGANNPVSDEARTALHDRGVKLVPDFIANPGGIIAAFVELHSTVSPEVNARERTKVKEAKELTERQVAKNVRAMIELEQRHEVEPARAGRFLAMSAVFPDVAQSGTH